MRRQKRTKICCKDKKSLIDILLAGVESEIDAKIKQIIETLLFFNPKTNTFYFILEILDKNIGHINLSEIEKLPNISILTTS